MKALQSVARQLRSPSNHRRAPGRPPEGGPRNAGLQEDLNAVIGRALRIQDSRMVHFHPAAL